MAAKILAQSELELCEDHQFPTPTGGITKGEVFQSGDAVFFAFTKANPDDAISGPLTTSPDQTMVGFEDIFVGIKKCPKALVSGAVAGTGGVSFDIGQDVFFNIGSQEVDDSKTTDTVFIGQAAEAKSASQSDFLVNFDGSNPSRSTS